MSCLREAGAVSRIVYIRPPARVRQLYGIGCGVFLPRETARKPNSSWSRRQQLRRVSVHPVEILRRAPHYRHHHAVWPRHGPHGVAAHRDFRDVAPHSPHIPPGVQHVAHPPKKRQGKRRSLQRNAGPPPAYMSLPSMESPPPEEEAVAKHYHPPPDRSRRQGNHDPDNNVDVQLLQNSQIGVRVRVSGYAPYTTTIDVYTFVYSFVLVLGGDGVFYPLGAGIFLALLYLVLYTRWACPPARRC